MGAGFGARSGGNGRGNIFGRLRDRTGPRARGQGSEVRGQRSGKSRFLDCARDDRVGDFGRVEMTLDSAGLCLIKSAAPRHVGWRSAGTAVALRSRVSRVGARERVACSPCDVFDLAGSVQDPEDSGRALGSPVVDDILSHGEAADARQDFISSAPNVGLPRDGDECFVEL